MPKCIKCPKCGTMVDGWDGVIKDMPKLMSPFIRRMKCPKCANIELNNERKTCMVCGEHLRYVVTPEIEPGYEWVFNEGPETVLCTEKLDGTDVSIVIEDAQITQIYNRTGRVPFFNKGKSFIIQGVLESYDRGYCNFSDGQHFGEVIGTKLAGNPYKVDGHNAR